MNTDRRSSIYAYPRLSKTDLLLLRVGGNGLGNLMFTWARAMATARRNGWNVIWPTWGSVKPKNWRANPYDHRTYFDLFRPTDDYITGYRKAVCLARFKWISETEAASREVSSDTVVEFRGMEGMFEPFRTEHGLVKEELLRIARTQHLAALADPDRAPIAIHVRRGDFVSQDSYHDTVSTANSSLPIEWYVGALDALRQAAGAEIPAQVFSDGTEAELRPLLDRPFVQRADYGSGLGDMLGLATSRALIASGSTFSMWGTFLGQVPTVWHHGKMLQSLLIGQSDHETEWELGDTPPHWAASVLKGHRSMDRPPFPGRP